jgi:hypothetical protein
MAAEVDALMVWDITELGNGVLDVVETAAWLHAQVSISTPGTRTTWKA